MEPVVVILGQNGRLVIPAKYREALQLRTGDQLVVRLVGNELHVTTRRAAIQNAQRLVRQHVPKGVSLVQELITERKLESDN